ncbi:creatininase family protein [Rubritalea tangerina]|uniref:Creatininase family protein n=2 Tax=Rubritalea tangerina TaxID=430798 RepID=A0ABW4ZFW7_9BACT
MQQNDISHLLPHQIYSALETNPIAWIPLGAIEWHGWHAPVGLDALTASGLCQHAANALGGVVLPPLHYGAFASIADHPWTILLDREDSDIIVRLMLKTLTRLESLGVKKAVILTGHFAVVQHDALAELQQQWQSKWRALKLIILSPTDCPDLPLDPDHGGLFETSLLHSLKPESIDLTQIPNTPIEETNPAGIQRRDPSHPLFGVIGADPRALDPAQADQLRDHLLDWIIEQAKI